MTGVPFLWSPVRTSTLRHWRAHRNHDPRGGAPDGWRAGGAKNSHSWIELILCQASIAAVHRIHVSGSSSKNSKGKQTLWKKPYQKGQKTRSSQDGSRAGSGQTNPLRTVGWQQAAQKTLKVQPDKQSTGRQPEHLSGRAPKQAP